jgi:chromatin segregation and condensation protein Rec8/ScpA/Scc1 (kleisin family)
MHFFNPPVMMGLIEVIPGLQTSEMATQRAMELSGELGKKGIRVKETPGFVVNRILLAMINEAMVLRDEGIASVEDIDEAMRLGAGVPLGPFRLADLVGLDVYMHTCESIYRERGDAKFSPPFSLKQMVRAGKLGRKTRQGFYKYSAEWRRPPAAESATGCRRHSITGGTEAAATRRRVMATYEVRLEQFTGPLDLLLHLVRTSEMDIFDLDLARLTEQYLEIVEREGVRDLAGAYHFLAMAATLVEMKSRMLLPRQKDNVADGADEGEGGEEEQELDPAEQLSRQLVAYQGIQDVTAELSRRYEQAGRHWPRALVEQLEAEIVYTLDSLSVYDLMSAFEEVLARPRFKQITIFREDYDLEEARGWLKARLSDGPALLEDLLGGQPDVLALITTFIGLLEMIKEDELEFSRDETTGGIWLTLAVRESLV